MRLNCKLAGKVESHIAGKGWRGTGEISRGFPEVEERLSTAKQKPRQGDAATAANGVTAGSVLISQSLLLEVAV
jgi:hypothetical protein